MNKECHGDYFSVEAVTYYRCNSDGRIYKLPYIKQKATCKYCNRRIVADEVKIVPTRLVRQVQVTSDFWQDLPDA